MLRFVVPRGTSNHLRHVAPRGNDCFPFAPQRHHHARRNVANAAIDNPRLGTALFNGRMSRVERAGHVCSWQRRSFATETTVDGRDSNAKPTTTPNRRRRRHNFDLDQVPSFETFQQHAQIRSLYRRFLRLAYSSSSRQDLVAQVRREFRQGMPDPWALKRALSDGGRRYKELSAMLSSVPGAKKAPADETINDDTSSNDCAPSTSDIGKSSEWPWQSGKSGAKPNPFPKR